MSRQQCKKKLDKFCFFCGESNYDVLDAHRIREGAEYVTSNIITCCAVCHRLCHSGQIVIDRKYNSTAAVPVVHFWMDGIEHWLPENRWKD